MLDYARDKDIIIALENCHDGGFIPDLKRAVEELESLKICLDTGHIYVYNEPDASMKAYVE